MRYKNDLSINLDKSFLLLRRAFGEHLYFKCCYTNAFKHCIKESTGFEPARQGILGSPDFESGALPLCQLSTTTIIIHDIGKTAKLILQFCQICSYNCCPF